jgi:hypothetical protein
MRSWTPRPRAPRRTPQAGLRQRRGQRSTMSGGPTERAPTRLRDPAHLDESLAPPPPPSESESGVPGFGSSSLGMPCIDCSVGPPRCWESAIRDGWTKKMETMTPHYPRVGPDTSRIPPRSPRPPWDSSCRLGCTMGRTRAGSTGGGTARSHGRGEVGRGDRSDRRAVGIRAAAFMRHRLPCPRQPGRGGPPTGPSRAWRVGERRDRAPGLGIAGPIGGSPTGMNVILWVLAVILVV